MNYKMIRYITGQLMMVEGALLLLPLAVALIYGEYDSIIPFVAPMAMLFILGAAMVAIKPRDKTLGVKEGFVIVGLSWVVMSVFGCLPFVFSGLIPSFVDAFFETVSGFTTTGASILPSEAFANLWSPETPEAGMHGIFLWRSFTHWVGGMGVLVFVLAVMPQQDMKSSRLVHVMRAEMPGPKVDKIVATVRKTSAIMYAIYAAMTFIQIILLLIGGMDLFDAVCISFGTAGTGGFSIWPDNMMSYGGGAVSYEFCTWVIAIFMLLFSVNFNVYFLLLTGKITAALFSEELWWFIGIVVTATTLVWFNIYELYGSLSDTLMHAFFQVSTIISTSGYATTDFNLWPNLSKTVLLIIMFIGACAGSTGGGIKVSRLVIAAKSAWAEVKRMIHPRRVTSIRFEKKAVDRDTVRGVFAYMIAYVFIFFGSFLIIAIADGQTIETTFSSVAACFNNIGPAFDAAGPMSNYAFYSPLAKIVLSLDMLLGRLEIFPILMLLSPSVWLDK